MKILFFDIDGCLNDTLFNEAAHSTTFKPECIAAFNHILDKTDVKLVISSAWRYLVICGDMQLKGFETLLRSHGIHCHQRLLGHIAPDSTPHVHRNPSHERGQLIADWLQAHPETTHYAVVDDKDLGISPLHKCFIQTTGKVGLTIDDAERIISILNGS